MPEKNITTLSHSQQEELQTALDLLTSSKTKKEKLLLTESIAGLYEQYGLYEEARNHWMNLSEKAGSNIEKAKCFRKITETYIAQRDHVNAAAAVDKSLSFIHATAIQTEEEKNELFLILIQASTSFYFCMNAEKLETVIKELRKLIRGRENIHHQIDFYFSVSLDFLLKYRWYQLPEEAVSHCEYYVHLARQTNNPLTLANALTGMGFVHLWREEITEARKFFTEAIEVSGENNSSMQMICYTYMSIGYRMQNNISMTELWTRLTIEKAEKTGNKLYQAVAHANLAWIYAKRKNWLYAEDYSTKSFSFLVKSSPLCYLALFPLIECYLIKDEINNAASCVFFLLHPKTKKLPPALNDKLTAFIPSWTNKELSASKNLLADIVTEARLTGYY